jgi:hypothetical protein
VHLSNIGEAYQDQFQERFLTLLQPAFDRFK